MNSKQDLRLPIDVVKHLDAYLRVASVLASRARLDTANASLQSRQNELERLLALPEPSADNPET